jgi:hypothetical protein
MRQGCTRVLYAVVSVRELPRVSFRIAPALGLFRASLRGAPSFTMMARRSELSSQ